MSYFGSEKWAAEFKGRNGLDYHGPEQSAYNQARFHAGYDSTLGPGSPSSSNNRYIPLSPGASIVGLLAMAGLFGLGYMDKIDKKAAIELPLGKHPYTVPLPADHPTLVTAATQMDVRIACQALGNNKKFMDWGTWQIFVDNCECNHQKANWPKICRIGKAANGQKG